MSTTDWVVMKENEGKPLYYAGSAPGVTAWGYSLPLASKFSYDRACEIARAVGGHAAIV